MHWHIRNINHQKSLIEKIFENRGLNTSEKIAAFLKQGEKPFHDPWLMKDMGRAVARIEKAIKNQERIIVYGDYDVDGMTGSAILLHTLKKLKANVSYRTPHRLDDGYGLHKKFIDEFAQIGVSLIITVDCGISCGKEIKYAREKNIDVIITDHHTIPAEPPQDAYAILHPLQSDCPYPFKGLTGAGVAFKLAHALVSKTEDSEIWLESLTDLASFGTVADLGPLIDENRTIVSRGMRAFHETRWPGLKYLKKVVGLKQGKHPLDTSVIGFHIAPRINAAGRIDSPYIALQLLIQQDEKKSAELAKKLEKLNKKRRAMTEKALQEAEEQIEKYSKIPEILIAKSIDWHAGILGLVAARLVEKYHRPAFIFQDRGSFLMASVRSTNGHNIMEIIKPFGNLLDTFGGHPQAAGLTVRAENFQTFCEKIGESGENFKNKITEPTLEIDCEIQPEDVTIENIELIEKLQPFGIANEQPIMALKNAHIREARAVGKNREHLKLKIFCGQKEIDCIAFRFGGKEKLLANKKVNVAGVMEKNYFNGKTTVQINVVDVQSCP